MHTLPVPAKKAYKGPALEGRMATWYAKTTAKDLPEFEAEALRIANRLPAGARVLEIAPGPGYLAIGLARLGFEVSAIDISRSFVEMVRANAADAGVTVDIRHGDAAALPYVADTFDFIVCRAAFKNFGDPVGAIREMHRVLKVGGAAQIIDMRGDASNAAIDDQVAQMRLGPFDAFVTGFVFRHSLRRRAYLAADFQRMAAATPFGAAQIDEDPLGYAVWLRKTAQ